ncbi:hypothetical protein [Nocardioides alcanivorans]|uniref:hypothetical protein n=1 Tax=Nocardioides alcanivorans TaxID=2897352 RepID=UPI001F20ABA5|nr:hypothetical protein [Nocardioides alcanivorans]
MTRIGSRSPAPVLGSSPAASSSDGASGSGSVGAGAAAPKVTGWSWELAAIVAASDVVGKGPMPITHLSTPQSMPENFCITVISNSPIEPLASALRNVAPDR